MKFQQLIRKMLLGKNISLYGIIITKRNHQAFTHM